MSNLEQLIWDHTLPIVERLGLRLYEVNFKRQKSGDILEVIIDKAEGVSIDDCTAVSEELNVLLDELDPISTSYTLEVSSAGCERDIRNEAELIEAVGSYIHVKTYEKLPSINLKELEGDLQEVKDKTIVLKVMVKTRAMIIEIEKEKIAKMRYAIKF